MIEDTGESDTQLKSFIERIERLEEEKAELAADIREIYAEAKSVGFDTKVMRALIRLRKMEKEERKEQEELLAIYESAVLEASGKADECKHNIAPIAVAC